MYIRLSLSLSLPLSLSLSLSLSLFASLLLSKMSDYSSVDANNYPVIFSFCLCQSIRDSPGCLVTHLHPVPNQTRTHTHAHTHTHIHTRKRIRILELLRRSEGYQISPQALTKMNEPASTCANLLIVFGWFVFPIYHCHRQSQVC
jgi:hypothetical protein